MSAGTGRRGEVDRGRRRGSGAGRPAAGRRRCSPPRPARPWSAADTDAERLAEAVDAGRCAAGGATVTGDVVDLLDLQATQDWADRVRDRVRPGRRPGPPRRRLARQQDLHRDRPGRLGLSCRTCWSAPSSTPRSPSTTPCSAATTAGYVLICAAGARKPTAGNAAYAAAKAAAEAWTLALADSFRRAGHDGRRRGCDPGRSRRWCTTAMRAEPSPRREVRGFTDVDDAGRDHRRPLGPARRRTERTASVAAPSLTPAPTPPSHDPDVRGFASDNYAGVHPEVLAALAAGQRRPPGRATARTSTPRTSRRSSASHFGDAARGLPGLQRHRRQRRRAAGDDRPLGRGDLRRDARTSTSTRAAPPRRSAASSCSPCPPRTASSPPS